MLIHTSHKKINNLKNIKQRDNFKPLGLWYAPNKIWLEFAKKRLKNSFKKRTKFIYIVRPDYTTLDKKDPDKVLQIKDVSTFDKFTITYGITDGYSDPFAVILIDWIKVEKDYGGVEVIPFLENRSFIHFPEGRQIYKVFKIKKDSEILTWLNSWDISSGCIWNTKAVKEFIKI